MTRPRSNRARGFTLIEALTTIVVLTVIGSVSSMILFTAADSYLEASTRAQIHTDLSIAMDRLMREIRKIPLDTAASGIAPDINSFAADDMGWSSPQTRIWTPSAYSYLGVDGGAMYLTLTDVTGFTIKAYDEDNVELTPPLSGTACDPIRRVQVEMTITRAGISETLRSKAFIRSTMAGAGS